MNYADILSKSASLYSDRGAQYGSLANANQNLALQQAQAMQGIGAQQQALSQQGMDIAYQNFQNQVNFPYQQASFMSNILHGVPVQSNVQQSTYTNPSVASQIAGLGIGGIGLSNMLRSPGAVAQ